ncbi:MAG: hypothetical protein ALAOOOJD_04191 [bacterium]|nr:hypothetical protein [bacterium]
MNKQARIADFVIKLLDDNLLMGWQRARALNLFVEVTEQIFRGPAIHGISFHQPFDHVGQTHALLHLPAKFADTRAGFVIAIHGIAAPEGGTWAFSVRRRYPKAIPFDAGDAPFR